MTTHECRHCGRPIELRDGRWASPDADHSDDSPILCEDHDTFEAYHEPHAVRAYSDTAALDRIEAARPCLDADTSDVDLLEWVRDTVIPVLADTGRL